MKYILYLEMVLLFTTVNLSARVKSGKERLKNGKSVENTLGVTNAGVCYVLDSTISCMKDGANKIFDLGSKVIKLWFAYDPKAAYPYNCVWDRWRINNCVDLAHTDYYSEIFDMDFRTFVLETHTFDRTKDDIHVRWEDGMSSEECSRLECEMYELTKYLMIRYNGTHKEFVLQNWEGDNMLDCRHLRTNSKNGYYYNIDEGIDSANSTTDSLIRVKIRGLTDWFNYRQKGVDRAREELKNKSDVVVRHALEINFVYLDKKDDGWPFEDSPTLLDKVVPYTDCDLYSLSCWGSQTMERANTLRERFKIYEAALGKEYFDIYDSNRIKPRRPNSREGQVTKLMLGEYGAIERLQHTEKGKWGDGLTYETDRRQREVVQIQTDIALEYGLEFALFWEIYCNVPRTDTNPPVVINSKIGEQAVSNSQLQGNWLIRVDGTCTEAYKYLRGLLIDSTLYLNEKFKENTVYKISGPFSGFEIAGELNTKSLYPSNFVSENRFNDKISIYASVDGKIFKKVETNSFYTWCDRVNDEYVSKVIYINKNLLDNSCRFIKIVDNSIDQELKIKNIKFYKSNPTIVKNE